MTTERMEAYAIEEGDQIFVNAQIYLVIGIDTTDAGYVFEIVDEEGYIRSLEISDTKKIPVVIDNALAV